MTVHFMHHSTIMDDGMPDAEKTMKLLQTIANHIHPSIRMTTDYPSKHEDSKVPMLNVQITIELVEGERRILYELYEIKMATKAVIHASSAIPMKTKRTFLTKEILHPRKNQLPPQ